MKKQNDWVKGKRRDDGLSAATHRQRDLEIIPQKQKKPNEKKEPKYLCGFVSIPLALRLCAWSQSHHARVSSCSAHRSQHRWHSLYPEAAVGFLCAFFPSVHELGSVLGIPSSGLKAFAALVVAYLVLFIFSSKNSS
ncbi:hypothetical protein STEG23_017266 [Scotinomys teguina]